MARWSEHVDNTKGKAPRVPEAAFPLYHRHRMMGLLECQLENGVNIWKAGFRLLDGFLK